MRDQRWRQRLKFLGLVGILVPAGMIAAGTGIRWLFRHQLLDLTWPPSPRAVTAGVLTALLSLSLVGLLPRLSPRLERALRDTGTQVGVDALTENGYLVMAVAVVLAAVGEEALFRGGLQPVIGLLPAALLFGFSHGGWRREMWVYAALASGSGALFGALYACTGSLWAPMTAHALHNLLSTLLMGKRIDITWRDGRLSVRWVAEEEPEAESAVATAAPAEAVAEMEAVPVSTEATPFPMRSTARQLGLTPGILPPGPGNNLCDVPGVGVGHVTVVEGSGPLAPGVGPVRTGVTAIVPHAGNLFAQKVPAGVFVLNGFGKSTGLAQVQELGTLETPIVLTNTLSAFRVADWLISYMIEQNPAIGITTGTVNPVVGECNDGFLNDIQGRHITEAHVRQALAAAVASAGCPHPQDAPAEQGGTSAATPVREVAAGATASFLAAGAASTPPVLQGAVGAGTGMVCFGFKGGVGSASRQAEGYTLGALVLANFGRRGDLMVQGVPVGQLLLAYTEPSAAAGVTEPISVVSAPTDPVPGGVSAETSTAAGEAIAAEATEPASADPISAELDAVEAAEQGSEPERIPPEPENVPPGSVMVILATDAPLDARQLTRLARRGAMGLARVGASAGNGSGDFIISFSTANPVPHEAEAPLATTTLLRDDSRAVDRLFLAVVEAVEEAVLNALFTASTVEGRDGHVVHALPVQRVLELVKQGR